MKLFIVRKFPIIFAACYYFNSHQKYKKMGRWASKTQIYNKVKGYGNSIKTLHRRNNRQQDQVG